MPLARYFLFVGAALLALLFVVDAYAPKSPPVGRTTVTADLSIIRIHSDRKWPERIVFDGAFPIVIPAPAKTTEASVPPTVKVADVSPKVRIRDSFAQLLPSNANQSAPADSRNRNRNRSGNARSWQGATSARRPCWSRSSRALVCLATLLGERLAPAPIKIPRCELLDNLAALVFAPRQTY